MRGAFVVSFAAGLTKRAYANTSSADVCECDINRDRVIDLSYAGLAKTT